MRKCYLGFCSTTVTDRTCYLPATYFEQFHEPASDVGKLLITTTSSCSFAQIGLGYERSHCSSVPELSMVITIRCNIETQFGHLPILKILVRGMSEVVILVHWKCVVMLLLRDSQRPMLLALTGMLDKSIRKQGHSTRSSALRSQSALTSQKLVSNEHPSADLVTTAFAASIQKCCYTTAFESLPPTRLPYLSQCTFDCCTYPFATLSWY